MVLVAIAPRPLFSRAAILKYGFGGSGAVGVTAIGGGGGYCGFWSMGKWKMGRLFSLPLFHFKLSGFLSVVGFRDACLCLFLIPRCGLAGIYPKS